MTLADVLMAAASADGEVCHRERRTIHRIFTRLLEQPSLPPWLEEHMRSFELEKFQLNAAAEALRNISPPQRRHIVELVRQVCDANNAYDLEEERYLLGLVLALSLGKEDVADLVIHSADGIHGFAKRVFDVLFSGAFLVNAWPLLLFIDRKSVV